jgi:hypothetical protein
MTITDESDIDAVLALTEPCPEPRTPRVVHIKRDHLRAMGAALKRERARREALRTEVDTLRAETAAARRQAALSRAGIKPGAAADLFLDRLPDDLNLDDVEAVRQACAEITSAVLGARDQLAEAGS